VHYRDKADLFLSDAEEFLGGMATALSRFTDPSDRVAPVRELFAHVAEMRRLHEALAASGWIHDFLELAQGHFARGIEQRLAEVPRARSISPERRTVMAQAAAGALLSVLLWWLARGMPQSAESMDELYHSMLWNGVLA
jgi:AcrR family transcriptional regulator